MVCQDWFSLPVHTGKPGATGHLWDYLSLSKDFRRWGPSPRAQSPLVSNREKSPFKVLEDGDPGAENIVIIHSQAHSRAGGLDAIAYPGLPPWGALTHTAAGLPNCSFSTRMPMVAARGRGCSPSRNERSEKSSTSPCPSLDLSFSFLVPQGKN